MAILCKALPGLLPGGAVNSHFFPDVMPSELSKCVLVCGFVNSRLHTVWPGQARPKLIALTPSRAGLNRRHPGWTGANVTILGSAIIWCLQFTVLKLLAIHLAQVLVEEEFIIIEDRQKPLKNVGPIHCLGKNTHHKSLRWHSTIHL